MIQRTVIAILAFCSLPSCKMVDKITTTSVVTGGGKSVKCVESRERELKVKGLEPILEILARIFKSSAEEPTE